MPWSACLQGLMHLDMGNSSHDIRLSGSLETCTSVEIRNLHLGMDIDMRQAIR